MRGVVSGRRFGFAAGIMLALQGCASDPTLDVSSRPDVQHARTQLEQAMSAGPVWLESNQPPAPLEASELGQLASSGIPALNVPFTTQREEAGDPSYRLVLLFIDKDALVDIEPCNAPLSEPTPELEFLGLAAAFCEGTTRIAEVAGPSGGATAEDARRLVWRATSQLFPDDWNRTYGLRRVF